jgi:hypothetical protein
MCACKARSELQKGDGSEVLQIFHKPVARLVLGGLFIAADSGAQNMSQNARS